MIPTLTANDLFDTHRAPLKLTWVAGKAGKSKLLESILDVRATFGETAVRHKKKLHLVVQLEQLREQHPNKIDRLRAEHQTYSILDVDVPEVLLFVAPGRNLAILVEAATRAYILRVRGIDPLNEFMRKQQAIISKSPST